jgi:formylglycine-generating enzyme required for sulfatase activity
MRRPGERSNDPIYVSSFCIDRFEYPNKGGAAPKIKVSWYEAKAACESQGKRLCMEKEWERACKGPDNYRYPYGNEFNDTSCNTADKDGVGRKLNATGAKKGCRSKFGVYDMSGNVREWTASRIAPGNPAYVVKGGSAIRPDWAARCAIREFAMPGQASSLIGFRCCSDAKKTE